MRRSPYGDLSIQPFAGVVKGSPFTCSSVPRRPLRRPSLAVIFSTGHADPTAPREHLKNPNVAFLTKPYQAEALLSVIESLLSDVTGDQLDV
jgi:CheY-like chemotaxis protein